MPQQRFYTGYSGQMAVVAELAFLGCNAAVPALDVGTDVFAFKEDRPEVARLQVKAAQGRPRSKGGCSGLFKVPLKALQAIDDPPLYYIFAMRFQRTWDFVIIGRTRLREYWQTHAGFGTLDKAKNELYLGIWLPPTSATCCGVDLTAHLNAWSDLPPLRAPTPA